jgi:transposase
MQTHRNAKLGLSGRFALVQAREAGLSVREVARRFSVSPATVSRWSCRWRQASAEERATLACLFDRSSRPRRMPRLLPAAEQRRICAARRRTGWGPRLLTVATGRSHSTISKVLKRNGLSRPERPAREPVRRYEWPCPGDLLHADWTLYARFQRPGHALTGDRSSTAADKKARLGYDFAHAIVDDHSRLAYAELLPDAKAATRLKAGQLGASSAQRKPTSLDNVISFKSSQVIVKDEAISVPTGEPPAMSLDLERVDVASTSSYVRALRRCRWTTPPWLGASRSLGPSTCHDRPPDPGHRRSGPGCL